MFMNSYHRRSAVEEEILKSQLITGFTALNDSRPDFSECLPALSR